MWRHIIESHSTFYIRCYLYARLIFLAYFTISVFNNEDCPCFEVKDEEDLLLEKTVRWYKTGWGKRQSKWLWNLEERRMTPAPDNFMHTNYIKSMRKLTCIQLQNSYKKKAQPNFLQTTRKLEIILTLFIRVFTISFLLLLTSSASVKFYKLTTLDKMILLAVNVPSTNKRLIFPFNFIYGQPVTRNRIWEI